VSKTKKCIFVDTRECPFQTKQIPFQTCQLCIEAWKTEVALKRQKVQGAQQLTRHNPEGSSLPVIEANGSQFLNEKLKSIDEMLKNDEIEPLEYIRLRKEHINSLLGDKPRLSIEEIEEPKEDIKPVPRTIRVAVITKSLFGKKIYTYPEDWALPKEVSDKVIDSIFKMAKKKQAEEIKLRVGEYKITCIAAEKNKLALMILDVDEEFETYDAEIDRIYDVLSGEKFWANAMKKI
jgi:hypothetical protein